MSDITDTQNLRNVTLSTPDISCDHCTNTIEKKLSGLDGIVKVAASVDSKSVDVEFDEGAISLGQIEAALSEEGYPVQR